MTEQLKPFEREQRYVVFKLADMRRFLTFDEIQAIHVAAMKLAAYRHQAGKPDLECVVVESDWPEYEPTWQAIEARTSGALTTSQPAQAGEVDERVAFIEWLETTWPKCYPKGTGADYWRNGHLSALAWKAARTSLRTQPAAQAERNTHGTI